VLNKGIFDTSSPCKGRGKDVVCHVCELG
jgi:hypothetical protein